MLWWSELERDVSQVDSSLYIGRKRNSLAIDQANRTQPIRIWQVVETTNVVVHRSTFKNLLKNFEVYLLYSGYFGLEIN